MITEYRFISILVFLFFTVSVAAQKKSRKQLEVDRNRIKKEIKMVNKLLFNAQKNEKNALEDLKDLNQKITIREKYIKTINLEVKSLSDEIIDKENDIQKLTIKLNKLKEDYATMIYKSYKSKSQQSRVMFLFSSKSFYQAYKRVKYMKQYASFRKKQGEDVAVLAKNFLQLKDSLLYQKKLKDTLLSNEEEQKLKIEDDKIDQQKLISQIKKQENKYKRELLKKEQEQKKISERIDKIIKDAIAKSNALKGIKKSKGFSLTPEAKALAVRFEQNKGKLPWPVESGLIVRRFGKQPHPIYSGNFINSTGIHIATKKGSNAEAIFNGEILAIQTQSEGKKSILIRHGNYISVYNNLETVYVSNGEKVSTGQSLGKIFTDRITGKTKLIFVLSKNTTRLNPTNWILSK
jgi:septal ring factor EnvC (AmiA/AmiB activator)|tara:strand:+ start:2106 stop:3323 length:1218 start_codon:yes stop_codon:yes gene_type:complete